MRNLNLFQIKLMKMCLKFCLMKLQLSAGCLPEGQGRNLLKLRLPSLENGWLKNCCLQFKEYWQITPVAGGVEAGIGLIILFLKKPEFKCRYRCLDSGFFTWKI
ncbi:protein of unknown function [Maridesulfovibrio hydrothermalis AM13 = DSM 14728]|uniref:Uncharacterized protein n=1 Tax=Maridesulfovibrio hydrothermalis AM13 = DSM 14728 TaxID=1121451 RepID=L0RGH8_9BACT|nr:protein of unknown function [Maridesulfovibrio hydrothermalis AM13 = DSM 14728]